jgi:hypothetical protein
MSAVVFVRFRPTSLNDYEDEILIIVGDGTIRVPILAQRERCQIVWPKTIDCGHCWVGDVIKKEVPLKNRGGEAIFVLLGSEEGQDSLRTGFFTISPTRINF